MRTKLKIFFFSLILANLFLPITQFASAFTYSDYELNAYNLTFGLNIPSNKIDDIHYDYDTKLKSFQSIDSFEIEGGQTVFKALANYEITVNFFNAYSAMDVYYKPVYEQKELAWATLVTADEFGVSVGSMAMLLLSPITAAVALSEASNDNYEEKTYSAKYYNWNLENGIYSLGWDGPMPFNINIADLTPEEIQIFDSSGNPITITQSAFDSNIVEINVGESDIYDIGQYNDYWINEGDTMGGINIVDLSQDATQTPNPTQTDIDSFRLSDVGDLLKEDIETKFDRYDLGVSTGAVEPASTVAYGSQGVTRAPTQGATITNGYIDFALKPHVQPYQQTLYYTDNPILTFDTENAFLQTSAGFIDASQVVNTRTNRFVGWHVYNKVIQTKINVLSEIYSTCDIDAKLGGSGDNLGIPDFQLEDIFWNLIFEGDESAIITYKDSPMYDWLQTYGPWIIFGLVALVAIYVFGPLIPQMIQAGASKSIKKWSER